METNQISIDFETYSDIDLKKTGIYPYASHPSTEVLILCYRLGNAPVRRWVKGDPMPTDLFVPIASGWKVRAFNAEFEMQIWKRCCVDRMGWHPIDDDQWLDTQALTYALALPGSLEAVGEALSLPVKKDPAGKRLIRKFCMRRKPTKNNPSIRIQPEDDPEDFENFVSYCEDDVRLECEIYKTIPLKKLNEDETKTVAWHRRVNQAGIHIDVESAANIKRMIDWRSDALLKELQELTDGFLTTSGQRAKFLEWTEAQGYKLPGFTKFDIENALADDKVPAKVRRALEIRSQLSQVSTKKFEKMMHVICEDGTAKGNLVYHRASTGRSGGAGLQLHNFPRDYVSEDPELIEQCLDLIKAGEYETVNMVFGDYFDVAKGMLRSMIRAPEGKLLHVVDFSGVENRGVAWFCRDPVGLQVFADGRDQYREFAAAQFNIKPEDVSPERRTAAKATILGAIFGSGWKTIYNTNVLRGIPMTEHEAQKNVEDFRRIYNVTASTWYELDAAAQTTVETGKDYHYKSVVFGVRGDFLFIKLPSGRCLSYYKPKLEFVETPWGATKLAVTYMGLTAQKKWMRLTLTPNRLIENIVSAICRDLLYHSVQVMEADPRLETVLTVHDEIVCYAEPGAITLEEYEQLMCTLPDWAIDNGTPFPLEAEGYVAKRYKK